MPGRLTGEQQAAIWRLETAADAMERAGAMLGSYSDVDASRMPDITVWRADDTSFCIQVGRGRTLFHYNGPQGHPIPGNC